MTEITRVPLQPIAKGSLTKLWLGIAIIVLLAAGIAWASMPKGVEVDTLTAGEGPNPQPGDIVFVDYVGRLPDGTEFDRSPPAPQAPPAIASLIPKGAPLEVDGVVPGFREALLKMQRGGSYRVHIPADLGYGANVDPNGPIPPNSDLEFDVTLNEFLTQQEAQALSAQIQQIMIQQQMQQMQQDGGAPGAPPPDAMPIPGAE